MFVSKEVLEERLLSSSFLFDFDRNDFDRNRDEKQRAPDSSPVSPRTPIQPTDELPSRLDEKSRVQEPEDLKGDDDLSPPCFSHLDSLLNDCASYLKPPSSKTHKERSHYKLHREAQKAVGEIDTILGPSSTATLMGLSAPQAFAYGEGQRSSNQDMGRVPGLKEHLSEVKLDIAMRAARRVRKAVTAITNEKIEAIESPLKLAVLGKDMASIVEKMSDRGSLLDQGGVHLHIYKPEMHAVDDYEIVGARALSIIDVGDNENAQRQAP